MFQALKNAFKSVKEVFSNKEIATSTKIKSVFKEKYFLSDSELENLVSNLELELLQADLTIETTEELLSKLKEEVKTNGLNKSNPSQDLKNKFLEIAKPEIKFLDINKIINKEKPVIILFIGTNGNGKTTTIAKFAHYLKKLNFKIVVAAADTYRAASIEQLEGHAKNIGFYLVKGKYQQDPASVAYSAIEYANKNNYDFVLIDTAGRQDNNINLMKELQKIQKVSNPDLTLLVIEAISGQSASIQLDNFLKYINIDGFILTKADVDEKGGTLISLARKIPILFIGVGQNYDDILFYNEKVLDNLFSD